MESAWLVVWSGLDDALSDDGDGGLVGLEALWVGKGVGLLWGSARAECGMDTDLFWSATTGLGAGGYHRDVGGNCGDDGCVFPSEQSGGVVDGALLGMGEFCDGAELYFVEDELEEFLTTESTEYTDYTEKFKIAGMINNVTESEC